MASNPTYLTPEQFGNLITEHRGWFIFEGIVFLLIGVVAIVFPFAASIATTIFLGALLLVGGIATAIRAFGSRARLIAEAQLRLQFLQSSPVSCC